MMLFIMSEIDLCH